MTTSIKSKIAASSKQFQSIENAINSKAQPSTRPPEKSTTSLKSKSKEIYQQKLKNRELAASRKQEKKAARENRNRILMHAGGLMDMTGMLRYCFAQPEDFDNPQDNLRANLLVGSLLYLSKYLHECPKEELARIEASGKSFRSCDKKNRKLHATNPTLTNAKSVRPLLLHEAQQYKNRYTSDIGSLDTP